MSEGRKQEYDGKWPNLFTLLATTIMQSIDLWAWSSAVLQASTMLIWPKNGMFNLNPAQRKKIGKMMDKELFFYSMEVMQPLISHHVPFTNPTYGRSMSNIDTP